MTTDVDVTNVFPVSTGIDLYRVVENELICQFAEPISEYYQKILGEMEGGKSLSIPMQLVWSQEFDGQPSRVQQLSVVTGEQTSISSLMIVTTEKDNDGVDKLNYSDDAGIRTISFQVRTTRFPEGKAIANSTSGGTLDPEMYALSQRNKDFADVRFAATLNDMEGWEFNGKAINHWSYRQNFKQSPDMLGGDLQTIADGRILVNLSQYPNPPETTPNFTTGGYGGTAIPDFRNKTFHCFWTTDHELQIAYDGVRLLPA
ncbi:hypothetical protein PhCBS80983_g06296 [Powellomyces hirtus]|uniref:Uncharacterized protein n=1 Tax=Powellomyces hirtus TaxID=109895 RepID=A0A507DQ90_9FUNG|nr:hypothetical protein PhCBS80983_g06296 [Powellomyces hirtus]